MEPLTNTLDTLVARFGGHLVPSDGDRRPGECVITGLCRIDRPSNGRIAALLDGRYARHAALFEEGVLLVDAAREDVVVHQWVHHDVRRVFRSLAVVFSPFPERGSGRTEQGAVVDSRAHLGSDIVIGAGAIIGPDVWIGDGATLGCGVILESGSVVGESCQLGSGAVIGTNVVLGARVVVGPKAVLGAQGFGFDMEDDGRRVRIVHIGGVVIEDDVHIGAGTCIDAGTIEATRVGARTCIDNLVHVAHNVQIGCDCVILAQVGIAGSAVLEDGCVLAGQVGVAGHTTIGRGAQVAAQAGVAQRVSAGARVAGTPAYDLRRWRRASVAIRDIDQKVNALDRLDARLTQMERANEDGSSGTSR